VARHTSTRQKSIDERREKRNYYGVQWGFFQPARGETLVRTEMTRPRLVILAALLLGSTALMFTNLGHYALWDDEANTALFAKSVWRTGDTVAVLGDNIIAYRSGAELANLRNRYIPPLGYYVAAPFVGILGDSAFAARLPFAICGLLTVGVVAWWLRRDGASTRTWLLMTIAVLGNVSLMLYSRQCRYYALAILMSILLAYLYVHWEGRRRSLAAMAAVSLCLLASNYLNYAALYACLLLDYLLWGRKRRVLRWGDALLLFVPQLLLGGLMVYVWNPLGKGVVSHQTSSWLSEKATLFWWNLRDLNRCELGVGLLIIIAPLAYIVVKDRRLVRGPVAILVYMVTVTLLSPQPVGVTSVADVRYLAPLIPLCIGVGVLCVKAVTARVPALAVPLALVAFCTNVLHFGPLWGDPLRPTLIEYAGEVITPRTTAYAATVDWICQNVAEGESLWVVPDYAAYPLMFQAPNAIYAWQLRYPPQEQFKDLAEIHFRGRVAPDTIIVFGPRVGPLRKVLKQWENGGHRYTQVATIDTYWDDGTRPELFWHTFGPVSDFDRNTEAVFVFRRRTNPRLVPGKSLEGTPRRRDQ